MHSAGRAVFKIDLMLRRTRLPIAIWMPVYGPTFAATR